MSEQEAEAVMEIQGMSCGACVNAVESALQLPGVRACAVVLGRATVSCDKAQLTAAQLLEAVEDCGFDAQLAEGGSRAEVDAEQPPTTPWVPVAAERPTDFESGPSAEYLLAVPGIKCARCVEVLTELLRAVPGVDAVEVSLERLSAVVAARCALTPLLRAAEAGGFPASLLERRRAGAASPAPPEPATPPAPAPAEAAPSPPASPRPRRASAAAPAPPATSLLRVWQLSCAACVSGVEAVARRQPGVAACAVSLLANTALVSWAAPPPAGAAQRLAAAISAAGFPSEVVDAAAEQRVSFLVSGLWCDGCPRRIALALRALPGVGACEAAPPAAAAPGARLQALVEVRYDAAATAPRALLDALHKLGYAPELAPCSSEAERDDERHAQEVASFRRAFVGSLAFTVPLVIIMMVLDYVPAVHTALMRNLLPRASTPMLSPSSNSSMAGMAGMEGVPGMSPSPAAMDMPMSDRILPLSSVISWALATPAQFGFGLRFLRGAARALRARRANMDVLVALGTLSAYLYSAMVLLLAALPDGPRPDGQDMFETPAMLITFVLLGKWLEAGARGRTRSALKALSALQPTSALLLPPGAPPDAPRRLDRRVPASMLAVGELVRLLPGARLPADGVAVRGVCALDESHLTGESVPATRGAGHRLPAGALCVGGEAVVRCTAVGAQTGLALVVALVRDAQASKAPIQSAADAVSAVFVPTIVVFAAVTFAAWFGAVRSGAAPPAWWREEGGFLFSFLFALSTLVIACPCALGLATPTAVMVASGLGAQHGILFKGGPPLQRAAGVQLVAFDKTGTLTLGKPRVVAAELAGAPGAGAQLRSSAAALRLAAALEGGSSHPMAKGICAHAARASADAPPPPAVLRRVAVLGRGVAALLAGGQAAMLGSPAWAARAGAPPLPPSLAARVAQLEEEGCTVLLLCLGPAPAALQAAAPPRAADEAERAEEEEEAEGAASPLAAAAAAGGVCALFALADTVKPDAEAGVRALRDLGIRCVMLTGDNPRAAASVARRCGIEAEEVHSALLPADKLRRLQELRAAGLRVAMVGDGVNDAPALAAADLGVAIGAGADVAIDAAGVVLVHSRVRDMAAMVQLARATMRRIRLNLAFSMGFNLLGVPIAAGVLYPALRVRLPPEAASGAMACSSVCVVLSSLSLRRFTSPNFARQAVEAKDGELRVQGLPAEEEGGERWDREAA